jgi:ATP-dependent RNA helicase DDX51/DBP6
VDAINSFMETLPEWLTHPVFISPSLVENSRPLEEFHSLLSPHILSVLKRNEIASLFPVQCEVIPYLLKDQHTRAYPSDICVSAPTGSGKTLSYAIPIIEVG